MSAANIASLVFFVFSLIAAGTVEFLLKAFAEEAGANRWVFMMVPAWFAVLYSQILYRDAERKVRRLGQFVSRGLLVMVMTWLSIAALTSLTWCHPRDFGRCLGTTLKISGIVGGSPMLLSALSASVLTAALIIRRPPL
jgi:hypothetical protein